MRLDVFCKIFGSGYDGINTPADREFGGNRLGLSRATGELGDAMEAGRFLSDAIELMVRRGERRQLMLANKAIAAYQQFRRQPSEPPVLASA